MNGSRRYIFRKSSFCAEGVLKACSCPHPGRRSFGPPSLTPSYVETLRNSADSGRIPLTFDPFMHQLGLFLEVNGPLKTQTLSGGHASPLSSLLILRFDGIFVFCDPEQPDFWEL